MSKAIAEWGTAPAVESSARMETIESFCARLDMKQGMSIVEIGSGLGDTAFYFADRYDAHVVGLDAARGMVEISNERARERNLASVVFEHGDIRTHPMPGEFFDLAWACDATLRVPNKLRFWQRVFDCLKPGGQLFITDLCRPRGPLSANLVNYLQQCQYFVHDIDEYKKKLMDAGFEIVSGELVENESAGELRCGMFIARKPF